MTPEPAPEPVAEAPAAPMVDEEAARRADAEQIGADIAVGRKVTTSAGIFTPEDLAQRVAFDGGYFYPTLSCGPELGK